MLGDTELKTKDGTIASGVHVELEDPNQLALVSGAGGQLVYGATGATLDQVALHEVGRALGLGANDDPNSVMGFFATGSNQSLDATDISGISQLYSSAPTSSAAAASIAAANLLTQAMASFGGSRAGIDMVRSDSHAVLPGAAYAATSFTQQHSLR